MKFGFRVVVISIFNLLSGSSTLACPAWIYEPDAWRLKPNVTNFSSKHYTYLVHALRFHDDFREAQVFERALRLISHPEELANENWISTSLISEKKNTTYSNFGFILEINTENVKHTSVTDIYTQNVEEEFSSLAQQNAKVNYTPKQLLKHTARHQYNEVVLQGTVEIEGKVYRVKSVAYFVRFYGKAPLTLYLDEIRRASEANNLPIIELPL